MWQNVVEPDWPHMATRRMPIACRISRLQANIQNTKYLLLFHSNNGYTNASHFYVYTYVAYPVISELAHGINSILTLISVVAVNKFYNKNWILSSCNNLTDPRKDARR
jgi:hypothetical protein